MKEDVIENLVKEKLCRKNLDAYSVFYTKEEFGGVLSITFFYNGILDLFLKEIDYKAQCDKSGFIIYDETRTILLYGIALTNFINTFLNEQ